VKEWLVICYEEDTGGRARVLVLVCSALVFLELVYHSVMGLIQ